MKKKHGLRAIALMLIMVMTLTINVWAVDESNADRLHDLGLFRGTGSGYALDKTATRMQGLIMLIRLLGEEDEALACTDPCPFTDVAAGDPSRYTAYAYAKGYTTGTTATTFSPGNTKPTRSLGRTASSGLSSGISRKPFSLLSHSSMTGWPVA